MLLIFGSSVPLHAADRSWLAAQPGLVDPGVMLEDVRVRHGGFWTWYLRRVGRRAITFGDSVWFATLEDRRRRALLAHELVHVAQYRRLGLAGFFVHYGWQLLRHGGYRHTLPLEAPAYARSALARTLPGVDGD